MELHAGHHMIVQFLGLSFDMDTLLVTWFVSALIIIVTMVATRKKAMVPSGIQNVVEWALEEIAGQLEPTLGKYWPMVSSMLFTFFLFILVANLIGLIPTNHLLSSPTADLNTAIGLALASTCIVWGISIKIKGFSAFKHLAEPYKLLLILNVFEELSKPLTLSFRLFGNILAGEILLEVMYFLIPPYIPLEWIWLAFSVFVGFIQAFIFTILTASYLGIGINNEEN